MALSGTIYGSFSGISSAYVQPYISWSGSQDIVNNYTNVTANVYFWKKNSAYWGYNLTGNATCNININGDYSTGNITFDLRSVDQQLVRGRTVTVYHNSDGTKSCYIGTDGNTNISWGTYNFGETVTLDTIPREAYLTNTPNFTIGNNASLTLWNNGNLWVKAELYVNGVLIKTQNLGQVTSATFTLGTTENNAMYAQMPNDTSKAGYFRIKTYSNSGYTTQIGGNRDTNITVSINQTINKPTFTTFTLANIDKNIEVRDSYNNLLVTSSTQTLLGSSSKMIKGYSKVRATVSVANKMIPLNYSTGNKYRYVNGAQQVEASYSAVANVTMDLDNVLSNTHTVTAFDSRNLTTAVNGALDYMANYANLSLFGLTLTRDNQVDDPVTLAFSGLMFKEYFGGGTSGVLNTLTCHYRWKKSTHAWGALDGTVTMTIASPCVVTKTNHGFQTGDQVWFTTTGALPTGLAVNTVYYVIYVNANTFRLATSLANANAGTAINTSGSQSGTHTVNGDSMWTSITPSVDGSGNITYSGYINGDLGAGGFDSESSFDIQVRGYDKLSAVIIESTLSRGIPLMDWTQRGIALNGRYDDTQGGDLQLDGGRFPYVGMITIGATSAVPTGWLECNGQAVSRTTYADLYAKLGTTYGSGDGSTTFNVPNLKGKVPVGLDTGDTSFDAMGETGGAKTHTLTESQIPSHTHTQNSHAHTMSSQGGFYGVAMHSDSASGKLYTSGNGAKIGEYYGNTAGATASNNNTGGGTSHNNLQPYITLKFFIKY